MQWFDREFIAVPENRKGQLIYKWPDLSIRRYSRVVVNADEIALFVKSGQVVATLGPGRHRVDADELPILGAMVDRLTGGKFYRAELYFVASRELPGIKFGGRLTDITDPASEQVVTLRAFGEFALAVRDPAELIVSLAGTSDLPAPAAVEGWCADLLLKSMKVAVSRGVSASDWPVLGLSGHLPSVESAVLQQTNTALYEYGLRIPRMGNFDITLDPQDADRLKRLAKDLKYIGIVGDFQRYAVGELALGAGQGFAHDGTGAEGGFLGTALGLNAVQSMGTPRSDPAPAPASEQPVCSACRTTNPADARFCMSCGKPLGRQPRRCRSCDAVLPETATFCTSCGAPASV